MPRRLSFPLSLALSLVLLFSAASAAPAAVILQLQPFSLTSPGLALGFNQLGLIPFDPALGTLDQVGVSITGLLQVSAFAPPNGVAAPVPYPFSFQVNQDFFGLAGKFFAFTSPGTFFFSGLATGLGQPLAFVQPFSYDFSFTALTDLIGFTLPATSGVSLPPLSITGLRADFLAGLIPLNEIDIIQNLTNLIGPLTNLETIATGALTLQYDFTPVPLPGTLLLLASGLLTLLAARRAAGPQ